MTSRVTNRFVQFVLFLTLLTSYSSGQELFNFDYSTNFPGYGYGYAYSGQGSADCTVNTDNSADLVLTYDDGLANPYGSATGDFTNWVVDPTACYTYAGVGIGVGHLLALDDGTGTFDYSQQFTSNDLSQYSVSFDVWAEGVDPLDPLGAVGGFAVDFQGPALSANGNPRAVARLFNDPDDPAAPQIFLTDTPTTYTYTFDELNFATGNDFQGVPYLYQSLAEYQAGDWDLVTQLQVQIQVQGDHLDFGLDGDNVINFDNIVVNAPFMDIGGGAGGDFNGDMVYDCADIDALIVEIVAGTNDAAFDLNGDTFVDVGDRDAWLAEAGSVNNANGNPFLLGDFNLDGVVDVGDFNVWNNNKFSNTSAWCQGDANADGVTDVGDFNIWNGNKFNSSDVASVPEPGALGLLGVALLGMLGFRRRD